MRARIGRGRRDTWRKRSFDAAASPSPRRHRLCSPFSPLRSQHRYLPTSRHFPSLSVIHFCSLSRLRSPFSHVRSHHIGFSTSHTPSLHTIYASLTRPVAYDGSRSSTLPDPVTASMPHLTCHRGHALTSLQLSTRPSSPKRPLTDRQETSTIAARYARTRAHLHPSAPPSHRASANLSSSTVATTRFASRNNLAAGTCSCVSPRHFSASTVFVC